MHKILWAIIITLSICSCTKHIGIVTGSNCRGKCYYNRVAVGRAEVKTFFGFKKNSYDNLYYEAISNLERAFPLQRSEFYDNYIIDYYTIYFPFYKKSTVTIRTNIVTEENTDAAKPFSENYSETIKCGKPLQIEHIRLSDSVIYVSGKKIFKGIVIDFIKNKALVMQIDKTGNIIFRKVPVTKLFCIDNEELEELTNYEAGQVLEISSSNKNQTIIKQVLGLRAKQLLILEKKNNKESYQTLNINGENQ